MITYLGTAGKINEKDINGDTIKKAEITLLEGYLWDEGEPKKHLIKQFKIQTYLRCLYQTNFVWIGIEIIS